VNNKTGEQDCDSDPHRKREVRLKHYFNPSNTFNSAMRSANSLLGDVSCNTNANT